MNDATKLQLIELSPRQLADVALSTIRSVIGFERYQYLSAPITGGRRMLEWHATIGRDLPDERRSAERREAVIDVNIKEIAALAARERADGRRTIEPGSFEADLKHWGQPEFYDFWDRVLEAHADRVVFADGWQYSAGCCFEYVRARHHRLETWNMARDTIDPDAARGLMTDALSAIELLMDPLDPRDRPLIDLHAGISRQHAVLAEVI